MNKAIAIMQRYPTAVPMIDFVVRDDGEGQYIAAWNLLGVNPPSEEEMLHDFAEWEEAQKNAPKPETDAQKIARLEAKNAILEQRMSQVNGNMAGFIDQYYIDFPEKA